MCWNIHKQRISPTHTKSRCWTANSKKMTHIHPFVRLSENTSFSPVIIHTLNQALKESESPTIVSLHPSLQIQIDFVFNVAKEEWKNTCNNLFRTDSFFLAKTKIHAFFCIFDFVNNSYWSHIHSSTHQKTLSSTFNISWQLIDQTFVRSFQTTIQNVLMRKLML